MQCKDRATAVEVSAGVAKRFLSGLADAADNEHRRVERCPRLSNGADVVARDGPKVGRLRSVKLGCPHRKTGGRFGC
eukprot:7384790-Prymnesium_polylepis.2